MTAEVCPYCRAPIAPEEAQTACGSCGSNHHTDCYEENGGCTIFGCSCAPAEEPKLSISAPDLLASATMVPTSPPVLAVAPTPPPPPLRDPAAPPTATYVAQPVAPASGSLSILGLSSPGGTMPEPTRSPKSRTTYIVLGALLGALGAHSFYAGYQKKGGFQLAITVLTLGFGSPMSWMWAIIDICTIGQDSRGIQFES